MDGCRSGLRALCSFVLEMGCQTQCQPTPELQKPLWGCSSQEVGEVKEVTATAPLLQVFVAVRQNERARERERERERERSEPYVEQGEVAVGGQGARRDANHAFLFKQLMVMVVGTSNSLPPLISAPSNSLLSHC